MPRGIRDRSLQPVPRPRSPSNHRPAQPQESAPPAREPNLHFSACSRLSAEAQIKPSSTESEADPINLRLEEALQRVQPEERLDEPRRTRKRHDCWRRLEMDV